MPTEKKNRFPRRRTLTKKNFEKLKKSKSSENRKGIHDGDFKSPQRLEEEIRSLCRSLGQEATVHLLKVLLQFQEKSSHPVRPHASSRLSFCVCFRSSQQSSLKSHRF